MGFLGFRHLCVVAPDRRTRQTRACCPRTMLSASRCCCSPARTRARSAQVDWGCPLFCRLGMTCASVHTLQGCELLRDGAGVHPSGVLCEQRVRRPAVEGGSAREAHHKPVRGRLTLTRVEPCMCCAHLARLLPLFSALPWDKQRDLPRWVSKSVCGNCAMAAVALCIGLGLDSTARQRPRAA